MTLAQMTVAELNTRVVAIAMAWFGLLLGSFATVVIYRLPASEQIVKGRSHCSSCTATLGFLDLIPLVSWLMFRGRCRHCRARVSFVYPLTEMAAASIASIAVLQHGASLASITLGVSCIGLATTACIDAQTRRLPNRAIASVMVIEVVGFVLSAAIDDLWSTLWRAAIVAVISFFIALLIYIGTRGGLGEGDVKFAPVVWFPLGWLGWGSAFGGYLVAALIAVCWGVAVGISQRRIRKVSIPFGPALALGAIITILTDFSWPPG
jgi:leader peptidase (prepilin peptidase)/N-methyltransferase